MGKKKKTKTKYKRLTVNDRMAIEASILSGLTLTETAARLKV